MSDHEASGTKGGQTMAPSPSAGEIEIPVVLWEELCKAFTDPNEWLDTVNRVFGYVTPRSMIAAGHADLVLDRVHAIQAGIFS